MELIEKLHALVECGNDDYFNDGVYASMEVVAQHSDWISVNERLPEDNQEVLAILELTGFYMLSFVSNGIWYNADDGEQIARHKDRQAVTYWMPTPQPPQQ